MSVVARRIARAHNAFRNMEVLSFSPQAASVEPMSADRSLSEPLGRLCFPVHDQDVTAEQVQEWLTGELERQAAAREQLLEAREEARMRNAIRVGERNARAQVGGTPRCPGCSRFKSRPSDPCDYCGMTVGSAGANAVDIDRSRGVG